MNIHSTHGHCTKQSSSLWGWTTCPRAPNKEMLELAVWSQCLSSLSLLYVASGVWRLGNGPSDLIWTTVSKASLVVEGRLERAHWLLWNLRDLRWRRGFCLGHRMVWGREFLRWGCDLWLGKGNWFGRHPSPCWGPCSENSFLILGRKEGLMPARGALRPGEEERQK